LTFEAKSEAETAKAARAARFGNTYEKKTFTAAGKAAKTGAKAGKNAKTGAQPPAKLAKPKMTDEEIALLKKRRDRFGETTSSALQQVEKQEKKKADLEARKAKRDAEAATKAVQIAEEAELKRKRAERFNAGAAATEDDESATKKAKAD
jgi:hypothetical protein